MKRLIEPDVESAPGRGWPGRALLAALTAVQITGCNEGVVPKPPEPIQHVWQADGQPGDLRPVAAAEDKRSLDAADPPAEPTAMSADELRRFLAGKQLSRRDGEPTPTSLEHYNSDGSWMAAVEGTIYYELNGRWDVKSQRDGKPQVCLAFTTRRTGRPPEITEQCRQIHVFRAEDMVMISDVYFQSALSGFDVSEIPRD